jgi:hypothetical protein
MESAGGHLDMGNGIGRIGWKLMDGRKIVNCEMRME